MQARYEVRLERGAARAWNALPPKEHGQIGRRLHALAENPRPVGSRKLSGELEGYRLSAGDFRIPYEVDDRARLVTVYRIAPRPAAYRRPR
jgi:mRNA interferase RelE/StbE